MHALHRSHLPHTVLVWMLAALAAVILALTMTASLNNGLRSSSSAAGRSSPQATAGGSPAMDATWSVSVLAASPFRRLVIAPVTLPWASPGRTTPQASR
jgi:hypothetical protein